MAQTETLTVTSDGTLLDLLLWRRFRRAHVGMVERTLDINPGLSANAVLPIGCKVVVELPTTPGRGVKPVVSLWD